MGLRGPIPMPTAIQQIRGNPGKRPLGRNEPQPRRVPPECPEYVRQDPVAHAEWNRSVPILLDMGVLTEADGPALALYCMAHSDLVLNLQAVRRLNAESPDKTGGHVKATPTGYLAPNQYQLNVRLYREEIIKLAREFGFTPSSRSRIQVEKERVVPNDPWSAM